MWRRLQAAGLGLVRHALEPIKRGKATIFLLHRSNRVHPGIRGHDPAVLGLMLRQMRRAGFRFVSVSELAEAAQNGDPLPGDLVAFTMDDGFADQAGVLAPVFLEEAVPLTFFVVTGFLDGNLWPWDAQINDAFLRASGPALTVPVGRVELTYDISTQCKRDYARRECLELCKRLGQSQLVDVLRVLRRGLSEQPSVEFAPMSWAQARELEVAGISFGSHTVSHRIVSGLHESDVHLEIETSMRRLREELTHPVPLLAWPIGRTADFSTREQAIAASHGIHATLATRGDYEHSRGIGEHLLLDRYSLPRDAMHVYRYATGAEALRTRLPIASREPLYEYRHLEPPGSVRERCSRWRRRLRAKRLQGAGLTAARVAQARVMSKVDWRQIERVIFACKGNLCRSPYAEVKGRQLGLNAASVGVIGIPDKPADPMAVRAALLCGVDLSRHRSNSLESLSPAATDLILCMDPGIERDVKAGWPQFIDQITLLGIWDPLQPRTTIADPFGGDLTLFFGAFKIIDRCLDELARYVHPKSSVKSAEDLDPAARAAAATVP